MTEKPAILMESTTEATILNLYIKNPHRTLRCNDTNISDEILWKHRRGRTNNILCGCRYDYTFNTVQTWYDGKDNNCDGVTDEDTAMVHLWYEDGDEEMQIFIHESILSTTTVIIDQPVYLNVTKMDGFTVHSTHASAFWICFR